VAQRQPRATRKRIMTSCRITIVNSLGLHARAAARFVHTASRFESRITVSKGGW
jgi:phosphocarrier protein HPr